MPIQTLNKQKHEIPQNEITKTTNYCIITMY